MSHREEDKNTEKEFSSLQSERSTTKIKELIEKQMKRLEEQLKLLTLKHFGLDEPMTALQSERSTRKIDESIEKEIKILEEQLKQLKLKDFGLDELMTALQSERRSTKINEFIEKQFKRLEEQLKLLTLKDFGLDEPMTEVSSQEWMQNLSQSYKHSKNSSYDSYLHKELLDIAIRGNEFELTDFLNKRLIPMAIFKPVVDEVVRTGSRAIVYTLLLHIAEQIKNDHDDKRTEVWPAYEEKDPNDPIFVVLTRTNIQGEWDMFQGFRVFKRQYDFVSQEAAKVINCKLVKDNPLDTEYFERLKTAIYHDSVVETHSNITIINGCSCRSKKGGEEIFRETCIVIHCLVKGLIPFNEEPFPPSISGIPVDVREGYMTMGMNQNQDGNAQSLDLTKGTRSTEFNKKLLMGTGISRTSSHFYTGTLGGFVDLQDGGIGFLTCAHVVGIDKDESVAQPSYGEFQPLQRPPGLICGSVENAAFNNGRCDGTGVDAAVVKITKRQPTDGDFIRTSPESLEAAGFSSALRFTSGKILTLEQVKENRRNDVIKVGSQSGLTRGSLYLVGTYVRKTNREMALPWGDKVEFFNQMEIQSHEGSKVFFDLGDSGSLVFMPLKDDELYCIGMAIGKTSYHSCLVTPICNVLENLGLPGQLKNFGIPINTTRTSQNHARKRFMPNFHFNVRKWMTNNRRRRQNRIVRR